MGLWTRKEAYDYLNTKFHMDKQPKEVNDKLIADLMAMRHRPWCRTHMASIAPNYGSECTCDGKYLPDPDQELTWEDEGGTIVVEVEEDSTDN